MYSNNPRNDKFSVVFSDDFFIPEICEKYNKILKKSKYPIDNIQDILLESIQGFETNDHVNNLVEQSIKTNSNGSTSVSPPTQTDTQNLALNKVVTIIFRHLDGNLNYNFLQELFYKRVEVINGEQNKYRKPFGSITHTKPNSMNTIWTDTIFYNCQFLVLPKMVSNRSIIDGSFDTFRVEFKYNVYKTVIFVADEEPYIID